MGKIKMSIRLQKSLLLGEFMLIMYESVLHNPSKVGRRTKENG